MCTRAKFQYLTCCVDAQGADIEAMVDVARDVTLATVRKHCATAEWEKQQGYGRHFPLAKDWHVSYHKSVYLGKPCYYICHSAIEYIWVAPTDAGI